MKASLLGLLARADTGARLASIACMAVMIAVVSAQVAMRYLFNGSFDWADELSRLAFVWTVFLAIPLGLRDGAHVGIDLVTRRLPPALQGGLARLMAVLAAAMLAVTVVTAIHVAAATWSERLGSLDLTSAVFFFPVIIGAAHAALHLAVLALWPDAHAPLSGAPS
ncbi:TRAP transporter small permease [Poseidonocella sp. HB161398]|uniref:TRAP transporter small permease n=1 Tax=Poseidonocella sp. HB161398 TaxID=2320855 RepID=UPI001109ECFF|nr:TRAP transporter small permease [Poseidonocella sp. HB161398]